MRKTFAFCDDIFIRNNQYPIRAVIHIRETCGKAGGKQDANFIRTSVLSQAVLNSPTRSLSAQHVDRILSAEDHTSMQEQAELRKTEPEEEDCQDGRGTVDPNG